MGFAEFITATQAIACDFGDWFVWLPWWIEYIAC